MRIDKPTIADFTSANHDHSNAAGGGNIPAASVTGTAVVNARQVISGGGLTGGGDLSADRTLAVGAGTGITVNTDDVAVTPHALLDGSIDSDTLAAAVVRGDIIIGNSTPKWARKAVGTGVLHADGTDVTGWSQAPTLTTPSMTTPVVSTKLDLTGGQIAFPAAQNASSDVNTLDDYEEHTSGDYGCSPTGFSGTPTVVYATYVKVGKLVTIAISFFGTSNATTMGFTLPFASAFTVRATGSCTDAGVAQNSPARIDFTASSTAATSTKLLDGTAYSNTLAKALVLNLSYVATA